LSGIPEVNIGIRKLVQAMFRSQGMLRQYFTDLFPYVREALRKFDLEKVWDAVYADVVTGDYELDRLALFLNRLYVEDRNTFASFMSYITLDIITRFHEPMQNMTWYFQELKELGFSWVRDRLVPSA
jgi:hypothetical protein